MRVLLPVILFFTLLNVGCAKEDSQMNGFNLQNQIYLEFKNKEGRNILDNSVENHLKLNKMKLFYLVNNEPVEVTVENGYNMGSIELTSNNLLKVFTNFDKTRVVKSTQKYNIVENIAYLKLSQTDTDTVKTYCKSGLEYFTISKVWYNNKLVWEKEKGGVIQIVK